MTKTRGDILNGYIEAGLSPTQAIARFKEEHPTGTRYNPRHWGPNGEAITFEAECYKNVRAGMTPDAAYHAALRNGKLASDYYGRQRIGVAYDLDWILGGNPPGTEMRGAVHETIT